MDGTNAVRGKHFRLDGGIGHPACHTGRLGVDCHGNKRDGLAGAQWDPRICGPGRPEKSLQKAGGAIEGTRTKVEFHLKAPALDRDIRADQRGTHRIGGCQLEGESEIETASRRDAIPGEAALIEEWFTLDGWEARSEDHDQKHPERQAMPCLPKGDSPQGQGKESIHGDTGTRSGRNSQPGIFFHWTGGLDSARK